MTSLYLCWNHQIKCSSTHILCGLWVYVYNLSSLQRVTTTGSSRVPLSQTLGRGAFPISVIGKKCWLNEAVSQQRSVRMLWSVYRSEFSSAGHHFPLLTKAFESQRSPCLTAVLPLFRLSWVQTSSLMWTALTLAKVKTTLFSESTNYSKYLIIVKTESNRGNSCIFHEGLWVPFQPQPKKKIYLFGVSNLFSALIQLVISLETISSELLTWLTSSYLGLTSDTKLSVAVFHLHLKSWYN